ncbi:MAG: hypothetical protein ACM3SY_10015 [Candidatus Omnitrophota bacterium]
MKVKTVFILFFFMNGLIMNGIWCYSSDKPTGGSGNQSSGQSAVGAQTHNESVPPKENSELLKVADLLKKSNDAKKEIKKLKQDLDSLQGRTQDIDSKFTIVWFLLGITFVLSIIFSTFMGWYFGRASALEGLKKAGLW